MQYEGNKIRHELKYYINPLVYHTLRKRLQYVMTSDPNMPDENGYLISSLYFDDLYHSAVNEKNAGVSFRKKYRIRCYGRNDDQIHLECKMKYQEYIAKEQAKLSRSEYDHLLKGNFDQMAERSERVCQQLLGYNRSRLLRPTVVVEYLREAYIAKEGNVRITFDKEIASSVSCLDIFAAGFTTKQILESDTMVMEVKYDEFLPSYIASLIQTGMTDYCAISKYVLCREEKGRLLYR
ncbi:MAG: polyphosphate polymerase domain-containing protein [Lachnospiraceae bacterium]